MQAIMQGFKSFCGLPSIQRAIDGMHFSNSKLVGPFSEDCFYHKTCNYSIVCQAIVDDKKLYTNLFVDSLGVPMTLGFLENMDFMLMFNNKDYLVQIKIKMVLLLNCWEIKGTIYCHA
jgi:hypothetical protein